MTTNPPKPEIPRSPQILSILISCAALVSLSLSISISGCRLSKTPKAMPLPLSERTTWSGVIATGYSDSLLPKADTLAPGVPMRLHRFVFTGADSLELRLFEFREAYWAYAAFQRSTASEGLARGVYEDGKIVFFLHGAFVGEVHGAEDADFGSGTVLEKLVFKGEELISLPKEFAAFPLLGRIPHSERVIPAHFLGHEWRGPVFTVAYKCHGDTATAFRAFAQNFTQAKQWMRDWTGKSDTLDWGREIHFQGCDEFRRPLIFWVFSEGVMGFEGCFDTLLAREYAEKMEKSAIVWPKP